MSLFSRWCVALLLIAVSLGMTGGGTWVASAGSQYKLLIIAGVCGINLMGVFLSDEMFREWGAGNTGRALLLTTIVIAILGLAANQDQIALRQIFDRSDNAAQVATQSGDLRDRRIDRAEQRVETARDALPALQQQVEVATAALAQESATGFGERSQAAQAAVAEANATLTDARQDLAAAEEALAELLEGTEIEGLSDAAIASQISPEQRWMLIWLAPILIEVLGIAGAALLRLRLRPREEEERDRPITLADLERLLTQRASAPPPAPQPDPPITPPQGPARDHGRAAMQAGLAAMGRVRNGDAGAPRGEAYTPRQSVAEVAADRKRREEFADANPPGGPVVNLARRRALDEVETLAREQCIPADIWRKWADAAGVKELLGVADSKRFPAAVLDAFHARRGDDAGAAEGGG